MMKMLKRVVLPMIVLGGLISGISFLSSVSALSECDLRIVQLDAVNYEPCLDTTGAGDVCSGTAALVGSNNEQKVYNFLIGKGLTPQQAAGVMGNLAVESGFIPNNQQNGSPWPTDGWGIAQWTGSRRDTLAKGVQKASLPYVADKADGGRDLTPQENDALLSFQLDFLYKESNERTMRDNPSKKEWDGLKGVSTVSEAVIYWEYNFERAGEPVLGERISQANDIFTRLGSGSASDASSSGGEVTCTGSSGQIVGGWSLPVDRKWYDSNPEWFTKPHHDYPSADIPVPDGTPIYSMTEGTITEAPIQTLADSKSDPSYGVGVKVQASDGSLFIYAHGIDGGSIPGAKKGDKVKAGQLIMHSNHTGNVTGPHLHLEIHLKNGNNVCPQTLLVGIATNKIPSLSGLPTSGCTY